MHDAGYFLPIITAVFLVAGASFVFNLYGAVSTLAMLPISVNIVLFHTVPDAGQLPLAVGEHRVAPWNGRNWLRIQSVEVRVLG